MFENIFSSWKDLFTKILEIILIENTYFSIKYSRIVRVGDGGKNFRESKDENPISRTLVNYHLSFKLEPHSDIEIQIQFPKSRLGTLVTPYPSVVNRELAYPHPLLSIHRTMLSIVDLIGIAGEDEQIQRR